VLRAWQLPANVQASRGCARRCAFCLAPLEPGTRRFGWRGRTPDSVADELADLNRLHGFRTFNFVDDDFLGPAPGGAARAAAIADAIASRGLDVRFGLQCRIADVPLSAFEALHRVGLRFVFVGIETADRDTGRLYRKPAGGPAAARRIAAVRRLGIQVEVGFIPLHPRSSFDQLRRDYTFLAATAALNLRSGLNRLLAFGVCPAGWMAGLPEQAAPSEDGTLRWSFGKPEVGALADALDAAVRTVRPLWTLVATAQPPIALAADIEPAGEAAPAQAVLAVCRGALDDWFSRAAFAMLDAAERGEPLGPEAVRRARDGGRLARELMRSLRRQSYGRLTPAIVGEVDALTADILAAISRRE
jgi:hypothetical protein